MYSFNIYIVFIVIFPRSDFQNYIFEQVSQLFTLFLFCPFQGHAARQRSSAASHQLRFFHTKFLYLQLQGPHQLSDNCDIRVISRTIFLLPVSGTPRVSNGDFFNILKSNFMTTLNTFQNCVRCTCTVFLSCTLAKYV